ncbi:hypothetical protein ADL35_19600, partial [Streptomyces sp. NRRL WC-3753]
MIRDRIVYRDEIGYFFDRNAVNWRPVSAPTRRIGPPPNHVADLLGTPRGENVLIRDRAMVPPGAKHDLAELGDRIWDLDLIAESLAEHPLQQAAVLSRPDGAQLAVLERHDERDGFLIAAVAPRALPDEAYRAVPEPNG